jgi:hypothetical protein
MLVCHKQQRTFRVFEQHRSHRAERQPIPGTRADAHDHEVVFSSFDLLENGLLWRADTAGGAFDINPIGFAEAHDPRMTASSPLIGATAAPN